jgi:hypothetical protein
VTLKQILVGSFALSLSLLLDANFAMAQDGLEPVTEINGHAVIAETWDTFTVSIPAGRWDVQRETPDEDHCYIQLTAKSPSKVIVRISLTKGLPSEDPHYENNPNMVNTASLLPVALSIASNDESRIYHSIGTTNLPQYWQPTSRIVVLQEDGMAVNLEACHELNLATGRMMTAVVLTNSKAGQVNEDPTYTDLVFEAYQIVSSIRTK